MKIHDLLTDAYTRAGRRANARLGRETNTPNLRVEPGGKSTDAVPDFLSDFGSVGAKRAADKEKSDVARAYQSSTDAAARSSRVGTAPATTTVDPNAGTAPQTTTTTPNITVDPNAGTAPQTTTTGTGDPTLDQPLAPRDPNAPGGAVKAGRGLGQIGKAIGAIGSIPQGIGRAIKKGYQAGVNTIGGPGPLDATKQAIGWQSTGGGAGGGTAGVGGVDPVQDLKNRIDAMDQRLKRAGIQEKRKN